MAQTQSPEARAIAHCGFLTFVAADQLHQRGADRARTDAMIDDLIEFASLYVSLTATGDLEQEATITKEIVAEMTSIGRDIHDARIQSMAEPNAVRLSNRLLKDCRIDLHLFEAKLRAG